MFEITKNFARALYRNLVTDRLDVYNYKLDAMGESDQRFEFSYDTEVGCRSKDYKIRVVLPLKAVNRRLTVQYTSPASEESFLSVLEDSYFEATQLDGEDQLDAVATDWQDGIDDELLEKILNPDIQDPTKDQMEFREQALAILDYIQNEFDLTRFQAHYVYSRAVEAVARKGMATSEAFQEATERVQQYMDRRGEGVRDLEPEPRPGFTNPIQTSDQN